MLSGRPGQARQHFMDALVLDPGNVPARKSLVALNEMTSGNPAEALRLCEEIQQLAPETPGVTDCVRRNRARLRKP